MKIHLLLSTLLVALVGLGSQVQAQTKTQYLEAAEKALERKDYHAALTYYDIVADAWPEDIDIAFQTAEAARIYNSYRLAEKYYTQVVERDTALSYPKAYYHLAQTKQAMGKYDQAIILFREYDKVNPDKSQSSEKEIESCQYANQQLKHSIPLNIKPIGLNTEYSEFAGISYGDTLYYSSMNFEIEDPQSFSNTIVSRVYYSTNDVNGVLLNTLPQDGNRHVLHTTMNRERNKMYFSSCINVNVSQYSCDIYSAELINGLWQNITRLPDMINLPGYSTAQPALAQLDNREVLIFVSDMPGGKGKMDLWMTEIKEDNTYGTPENLSSLNTVGNDIAPFYHRNSSRLFLSSDGRLTMGGFDIYETNWKDSKWSEPQGLPVPFNSGYHDLYFTLSDDGSAMYMTSNRDSEGAKYIEPELQSCCNDIFKVSYAQPIRLEALAFDKLDSAPLPGTAIALYRKEGPEWILVEIREDASLHKADFDLLPGQNYCVIGSKLNFISDTVEFNTYTWDSKEPIRKELFLSRSQVGLDVYTFDDLNKLPLNDAFVRLYDVTNPDRPILVDEMNNKTGNHFTFSVLPGKKYQLKGSADGYQEVKSEFDTYTIPPGNRITQNLYLPLKSLTDYLPLAVYFDNDIPDRRGSRKNTDVSYLSTYPDYLQRQSDYESIFQSSLTEQEMSVIRGGIRTFFTEQVVDGMNELNNFAEALAREVKVSSKIIVTLEGFTSPRAESRYNLNLGYRRAASVRNFFLEYNNGVLKSYIDNGTIVLKEVSYGETRVKSGVSDDLEDELMSIYAIEAAEERRAEINAVEVIRKN